ncbi:hypothetical protein D9M70_552500 [compost metagenome]
MRNIVSSNQVAHLRGQGGERVMFNAGDLVEQFVESLNQGIVISLGLRGREQRSNIAPVFRGLFQ